MSAEEVSRRKVLEGMAVLSTAGTLRDPSPVNSEGEKSAEELLERAREEMPEGVALESRVSERDGTAVRANFNEEYFESKDLNRPDFWNAYQLVLSYDQMDEKDKEAPVKGHEILEAVTSQMAKHAGPVARTIEEIALEDDYDIKEIEIQFNGSGGSMLKTESEKVEDSTEEIVERLENAYTIIGQENKDLDKMVALRRAQGIEAKIDEGTLNMSHSKDGDELWFSYRDGDDNLEGFERLDLNKYEGGNVELNGYEFSVDFPAVGGINGDLNAGVVVKSEALQEYEGEGSFTLGS